MGLVWKHQHHAFPELLLAILTNDDIVTWDPVDRGGDLVLVAGLERVHHAEDLSGVAAGRGWVGHNQADGLLWVDDEDAADGEGDALGVDVGGILVVDPTCVLWSAHAPGATSLITLFLHVVGEGDLALLVADDREAQPAAGDLVDVLDPAAMALDGVGAQSDELDATLGELGLELWKSACCLSVRQSCGDLTFAKAPSSLQAKSANVPTSTQAFPLISGAFWTHLMLVSGQKGRRTLYRRACSLPGARRARPSCRR